MSNLDGERKRILVVNDREDERYIVSHILREYDLVMACDFKEGLHLAQQGGFDLYILDSRLPDKSGVELCRAIRGLDSHTPILLYSAAAYPEDIRGGLEAGAQAYLVKPVSPEELSQAVVQLLSAR
jgi:two-component system sensor histidine kinase ChiS